MKRVIVSMAVITLMVECLYAGNPDRSGQAGATELLINPWARSSGWHGLNTANIRGVEAMRLNIAGMAYTKSTEVILARANWWQGSGIGVNTVGISQHVGAAGVLGLEMMAMTFGEIERTTEFLPEGGLGTYSPLLITVGAAYSHMFSNSISAGMVVRGISESIPDASAMGVALDAGVQYVTGPYNNIKFGIAIRNVGTPMRFSGDGLSFTGNAPDGDFTMTQEQRSDRFELPSLLNIGAAYDLRIQRDTIHRITVVANFISNSFSYDEYGVGLEYSFKEHFMVRAGYKVDKGVLQGEESSNNDLGPSGGFTIELPLKKGGTTIGLDYSYRAANLMEGIHTLGLRINL